MREKNRRISTIMKVSALYSYMIMLIVIFVLPFFSAEGYSIIRNTTSQLGAQNTPNALIMNVVFALLGVTFAVDVLSIRYTHWLYKVCGALFGLSLLGSAIFHHAPIQESVAFRVWEDQLHSFFASLTGFAFVGISFSSGVLEGNTPSGRMAFAAAAISVLMSLLMFLAPDYMGIWQRTMFALCFLWLLLDSNAKRRKQSDIRCAKMLRVNYSEERA